MSSCELLCPVCNSKVVFYEGKEFGYCKYCGDKIERNDAMAHSALALDEPEMILDTARLLMSNDNADKQKQGFDILKTEVEKKRSLRAYDMLVEAYKTGVGTETSYKDAFKVLENCVTEMSDDRLETLREIANTYYFGEDGVSPNHKKALSYYKMAEKYSDPSILYNIAVMLMKGDGCKVDMYLGDKYMTKAAKAGHAKAAEFVADVSTIQQQITTCKYCKSGICFLKSGTVMIECYYEKNNITMTLCKDFQKM